ncbi:MBL fold metallo-hydrolase [Sporosarcina sp. P33]|uniref:MBL fold metallo-hydrolase n=1 Tax=Sporosarcina sp. P33 TaxID=1930764 RepID=UPI0009C30B96|nr:MBL fold metallo-hydrolase [Sporosarcina sp. P33]ARD49055.1 hypothetical protein SporoP33_12955 [Sporosarcina sp. P33]
MYNHEIFVQGFPGKSKTHGGLGWSTITLLTNDTHNIIVDAGSFGVRKILLEKLRQKGLTFDDIDYVLLTHTHWDHSVNWTMFPNATIVIGDVDLEWALNDATQDMDIPELYIKELSHYPKTKVVGHLDEVLPGIVAHQTSGHTPGHITYTVDNGNYDLIFCGDAAKNRAELLSQEVDMTLNLEESKASIQYIWNLWEAKQDSLVIPGHDIPMKLENGVPVYVLERRADLQCWFSSTLNDVFKAKIT